jgi:putative aldouronate transport system permease protein
METSMSMHAGRTLKKRIIRHWPLYLMMLPGLAYIGINNYLPMIGLQLAFKKFKFNLGIFSSPWTGLKNFVFLFKTNDAWTLFRNTILYNLAFIILGTVLSIFVAILINEIMSKKAKRFYQTITLIPHLLSWVVIGYIAYAFLGEANGMINNSILLPLGLDRVAWYSKPAYWPYIIVISYLWRTFGYQSIIYYASIVGIDKTYYEAAVVDGATTRDQIFRITLPLLKPTIITLTLLSIGRVFYSDFGLFYQLPMNTGLLYSATNTIDTYVYRGLMETSDIGRSAAAGFLQSILGFIMVYGCNMLVRKIEKDSSLF